MAEKRKADSSALVPVKKGREGELVPVAGDKGGSLVPAQSGPKRTSSLQAPIMLLTGHKVIFLTRSDLWNTHGDCVNYAVLKGHSGAILEVHWSPEGTHVFSASTDKAVAAFDASTTIRVKKFHGHQSFVNSCHVARKGAPVVVSGSDDATVKLWDLRVRTCTQTLEAKYPVTAVSFNDAADQVFSGGVDNVIKVWDLRKNAVSMQLDGHVDTVTGLSLSPDGSFLLSNAMDNCLKIWDIRPFVPGGLRDVKTFHGVVHTFEKNLLRCSWSPDGSKISAGSGDRYVYIWDTTSRRILYKLPGHAGAVNEVVFHPKEPIIGSCSSDKNIYLGELLEP